MENNNQINWCNKKHNRLTDPFGLKYVEYSNWNGTGNYYFILHFRDRDEFEYKHELEKPNVFLILTDVLEGYALRRFKKIDSFVCDNNLQGKVIFATCLVDAEKEYSAWTDSPNFRTIYYPEWYHRVYDNLYDYHLENLSYDRSQYFCCLNNRPHDHRIKSVDYLLDNNLDKHGIVTSVQHNMLVDGEGSRPNDYNRQIYKDTLINVVTETHYEPVWNKHHHIFLSEKTWKPIVCKQAFIIIGPQYTLKYLKDLGFKTFGELWDESYDECNSSKRLYIALNSLYNAINSYSVDDLVRATLDIRKHNLAHFKNIRQEMIKTCT